MAEDANTNVETDETNENKAPEQGVESTGKADESSSENEGTEKESGDEESETPSVEELLAERKKLRAESANYRTKLREREKQLKEAKSLDEVEALVAEMTAERESEQLSLVRENVALKYQLPEDLAGALKGDTREELEAHAKVLAKYAPASEPSGTPRGGLDPQDRNDDGDLEEAIAQARKVRRRGY